MRYRRFVGMGYGPFWRGVIFDREYKNLDDLILKSKRWFYAFDDGAKFLSSTSELKWVWPTGEELLFRQAKKPADYYMYHGQEFAYIGWNELTKYPTPELYDMMTSVNRSSFRPVDHPQYIHGEHFDATGHVLYVEKDSPYARRILLPEIPLQVFSTTNPYGPGHAWVKRRFIDVGPYGRMIKRPVEIFNPRTQKKETVVKTQVTLFGSYKENIYLAPEYVADLVTQTDENKRKAWLEGDWDIVAGGALDDVWSRRIHVLPRFPIPAGWRIDRALDWGSTHPCSVGWFAEANGEEARIVLADGRVVTFCPPAGTIIQIAELYLTKEIGLNQGLKKSGGEVAELVRDAEIALLADGWIVQQPYPGPADNQIRDVRESDVDTIEKKMGDKGIRWELSDKSPGSRRNGLQLIRDRLEAAIRNKEEPHLYFFDNCLASISLLPTLPRDETKIDDVDTDSEDHAYDMVRYRVLRGANRQATGFKLKFAS